MNKNLISEVVTSDGTIIRKYSEEFNPQDVHITYYASNGYEAKRNDKVMAYDFEVQIPSRPDLKAYMFCKVIFPVLDVSSNETALIKVEYQKVDVRL